MLKWYNGFLELVTLSRKPYLAKTNMYFVGFWDLCIFVLVQIYYIFLSQTQCIHFTGERMGICFQFFLLTYFNNNKITQKHNSPQRLRASAGVDLSGPDPEMQKVMSISWVSPSRPFSPSRPSPVWRRVCACLQYCFVRLWSSKIRFNTSLGCKK